MGARFIRRLLPCALALAISTPVFAAQPDTTSMGQIEALRTQKAWLEALQLIERAYAENPGTVQLSRLRALTLADLGSFYQAWQELQKHPELYSPEETHRLKLGALARETAWAKFQYPDEKHDLDLAQAAERDYNAWLQTQPQLTTVETTTLRSDRLILSTRLRDYKTVATQYESMRALGQPVEAYALPAVGEAYRALRQPGKAVAVYDAALLAYPNDPTIEIERAYAMAENEDIAPAVDYLWRIREHNPAWVTLPGSKTPAESPFHMDAEVAYYMVRSFGNDLKGAQAGYEGMAEIAPANPQLQEAVGSVYLRRGWPTRGLQRFEMAETLDPNFLNARIGQVGALMALDRYDLARPIYNDLATRHAGVQHVTQLTQEWHRNTGWQMRTWFTTGRSSGHETGVATPYGDRDRTYGIEVATPLMNDRWRLFAYRDHSGNELDDGTVNDGWTGVGVHYVFNRVDLSASVGRSDHFARDTELALDLRYRVNDIWTVYTGYARNDHDIPIQARMNAIRADSWMLGSTLTPSELSEWSVETGRTRFSDGNTRTQANSVVSHRLLTRTHFLIDGRASAYGSRNRGAANVPYFNPESDAGAGIGLRFDHLAWRRYTDSFRHVLQVDAGPYWQKNFGTHVVPSARYSHQWRFGNGWGFDYGVSWSKPVYDGHREQRVAFDASIFVGAW